MSLNPTSSAVSSSCVATAIWRSTPLRSSSSWSDRLRPTESGMKMRGKTTVDFRGRTGRCDGTAPSRFGAGTSLTATQYCELPARERRTGLGCRPVLPGAERCPALVPRVVQRVLGRRERDGALGGGRKVHRIYRARRRRRPGTALVRAAWPLFQVPGPAVLDEERLGALGGHQRARDAGFHVQDVDARMREG